MAKKKSELENDFFAGLAKNVGGDLLDDIDKCRGFIDTGILAANFIVSGKFVGGGFPMGAMAEVSGESATGKSLLGMNLLKGAQKANGIPVFLDAECAVSKDFAIKAAKIDPSKMLVVSADTLEKCFNLIHKVIRQARSVTPLERPLVIIYDSIAVSPSEREFAWTELDAEKASATEIKNAGAGAEKPGERARICSSELRKLMPIVKEQNVCILFVNQLRDRIGVLYGDPKVESGGGQSLKYYCSTRLRMTSAKQLKDSATGLIKGSNVTFINKKSRFTAPFKEARVVRLDFERGIDPFGGLLELMLQIGRVEATSAGNFKVKEPWAGGREVKFKSSKERNDIPADVLLDCPALVDAESADQVQYYIDMFGGATEAVNLDSVVEEDLSGE